MKFRKIFIGKSYRPWASDRVNPGKCTSLHPTEAAIAGGVVDVLWSSWRCIGTSNADGDCVGLGVADARQHLDRAKHQPQRISRAKEMCPRDERCRHVQIETKATGYNHTHSRKITDKPKTAFRMIRPEQHPGPERDSKNESREDAERLDGSSAAATASARPRSREYCAGFAGNSASSDSVPRAACRSSSAPSPNLCLLISSPLSRRGHIVRSSCTGWSAAYRARAPFPTRSNRTLAASRAGRHAPPRA